MSEGLCQCGCGKPTEISTSTRPRAGWVKGQPKPFLPHHSKFTTASRDGRTKRCRYCKAVKPLEDFAVQALSPDGRQPNCRSCNSATHREYRAREGYAERSALGRMKYRLAAYGLTPETYHALFDAQHGCCAICGLPESARRNGKIKNLAIDHDHATGHVRGLLCTNCNQGLGAFLDDEDRLAKAISYLRATTRG